MLSAGLSSDTFQSMSPRRSPVTELEPCDSVMVSQAPVAKPAVMLTEFVALGNAAATIPCL